MEPDVAEDIGYEATGGSNDPANMAVQDRRSQQTARMRQANDARGQNARQVAASRNPRFTRAMNMVKLGIPGTDSGEEGNNKPSNKGFIGSAFNISIFIVAISLAILLDVGGIVFEILPGVGGILSSILITPIGVLLILGYKKYEVGNIFGKSLIIVGICAAIEFIPVINMLPGFTAAVILIKIASKADKFISEKLS
jgi:hypothetical protein